MRLAHPFFRLPVIFDATRLREEVDALPATAWAEHPNRLDGNSSVRLISVDGAENDSVEGRMLPTAHLARMPYVRQVLASFGVVWSRSRLMRLAPGANVPPHSDINYHWYNRVRVHIPVITRPEVRFHCGESVVHMAAGEAWIFDSWRPHRVENPTREQRIHLVADTTGSAAFWKLAARALQPGVQLAQHRFEPAADPPLLTEQAEPPPLMSPWEVEVLAADLKMELHAARPEARPQLPAWATMLDDFCRDWRQLTSLYGADRRGREHYARLRDRLREQAARIGEGVVMRTNGTTALRVLEARILRQLLRGVESPAALAAAATAAQGAAPAAPVAPADNAPVAPVFIVAAPRSGSTLLYETLATHGRLANLGGEAHWLVEGDPALRPGAPGVESNRLTAAHATPAVAARIRAEVAARARPALGAQGPWLLEKTPKNALRVPFLLEVFPDAQFIFLQRDPRANLSSMMQAWRAKGWITYRQLPGWPGPWSLLLPPGYERLQGRPLEEGVAFQWRVANETILDDLADLPRERWTTVRYEAFVADPRAEIGKLLGFAGLAMDPRFEDYLSRPLPLSKHTQTRPDPDKWKQNAAEIERVLPQLEATARRLRE